MSLKLKTLLHRTHSLSSTASPTPLRTLHVSAARAAFYPTVDLPTFDALVARNDRIVVVDFFADWCGPCRQLAPVLEKLTAASERSGSGLPLDLVKVNTDDEQLVALAQKYKVRALPTVIAFKGGEPIDQFVGALNDGLVRNFIQNL